MLRHVGGFLKNPGKTIREEIARVPDNIHKQGKNVAGFMADPVGTALAEFNRAPHNIKTYLREFGDVAARLALMGYYDYLASQASWKTLPPELISVLSLHYPGIDLKKVRYAENINTIHGAAITFGNDIFFTRAINPTSEKSDLQWLLHELEHVSQYEKHGGMTPFLIKYVINGAIKIGEKLSINIHDDINLERDAINKENIIKSVWNNLQRHTFKRKIMHNYNNILNLVLLYGNIRTTVQLSAMSREDKQNTLIVELNKHTGISISRLHGFDEDVLVGLFLAEPAFALLALRARTLSELSKMSLEDKRNTLIVEINKSAHISIDALRGLNNIELCKLASKSIDNVENYSKSSQSFQNTMGFFISASGSSAEGSISELYRTLDNLIDEISGILLLGPTPARDAPSPMQGI